jgi:penicillin-binding protein-related factor A (putative recombinase)
MAQNEGKKFESDFQKSIPEDVYFYRLRDTASAFGGGSDFLRFSSQNHYDCFLYKHPFFYPTELKSNQGTSFSIQHTKEEKGKDIKLHQIEGLTAASKFSGAYAGLILNFRKTGNTYWLDIRNFNRFNEGTEKKSINEKDVQEFGGIGIRSEIKRVRYKYFIGELIEKIQSEVINYAN